MLLIAFSGIFKPIRHVWKGLSSAKFASIIDKVVLPIGAVAIGIKQAQSQSLPPVPAVQPDSVAGTAGGTPAPWYKNPVTYLAAAGAVLIGALVLSRRGGG